MLSSIWLRIRYIPSLPVWTRLFWFLVEFEGRLFVVLEETVVIFKNSKSAFCTDSLHGRFVRLAHVLDLLHSFGLHLARIGDNLLDVLDNGDYICKLANRLVWLVLRRAPPLVRQLLQLLLPPFHYIIDVGVHHAVRCPMDHDVSNDFL